MICTTIEQSKKLLELGIDRKTSDMYYWCGSDLRIGGYRAQDEELDIPAWSFSALLGLMPTFTLNGYGNGQFNCRDERANNYALVDTCPLDAAFEMVCWLKENEKI